LSDKILCRCEEVLDSEIRQAIREGARSPTGIKVRTRAGMGLCQGKTCQRLVARILAEETGQSLAAIQPMTGRPPCRPVIADALACGDNDDPQS
jgi:bacterioferritin-associated ferredoxin